MLIWAAGVIKEALDQGADIVICPRVTDAAVVIGPAAWKFNWQRDDYDALAGALTAGHIIECGAQCCGGNYAFFEEVAKLSAMLAIQLREIEADGSFTITKHPGTGGLISEGTVKAQLLYEISTPAYYNPDVIAHFDTLQIAQAGADRVYVSGCRGSTPPYPQGLLQYSRTVQTVYGDSAHGAGHRRKSRALLGCNLPQSRRSRAIRRC